MRSYPRTVGNGRTNSLQPVNLNFMSMELPDVTLYKVKSSSFCTKILNIGLLQNELGRAESNHFHYYCKTFFNVDLSHKDGLGLGAFGMVPHQGHSK